MAKQFFVYILSNSNAMLYVGMTNDIFRRINEHKKGLIDGYTKKFNIHRLIYFEEYQYVEDAIAREKQIKKWGRKKKLALVKTINPQFKDLSEILFDGN